MPQSPTPNMLLVSPTPGSDPNAWGTILNTLHALVDSHTHLPGAGVKVPVGALQWDADLIAAFAGTAYALTGTKAIDFTPTSQASVAAYSSAVFTDSADNNLKFRNSAGQIVRITNGATLDVTSVGGFGGDYASAGAEAGFTDGADTYYFKQQVGAAVRQFARMQSADVDLYEYKAHPAAGVPTNRVRLQSPAALAASYALTLLPALPATTRPLYVTAAGLILSSVDEILDISPMSGFGNSAGITSPAVGSFAVSGGGGGAVDWFVPFQLPIGARIKTVTWYYKRGAGTLTFSLRAKTLTTGVDADVGTPPTSAAGTAYTNISQTSINKTVVVTESLYLRWSYSVADPGNHLHAVQLTYDRGA